MPRLATSKASRLRFPSTAPIHSTTASWPPARSEYERNIVGVPAVGATSTLEDDLVTLQYLLDLGSLMYLALGTRPDLAFAVGYLGRFSSDPRIPHWVAVKRVFRYLAGIFDKELVDKADGNK
jgi:hypothetical protein